MLSIANLSTAEATTHYFELEDYYAKDDPEHKKLTSWYGKGAERFNLKGEIDKDIFSQILNGVLPNGDILGRKGKSGEREHAVGIDATFSAPKSVSIMSLAGRDTRLIKAHQKAVKHTLSLIEREHMQVRVRSGGIVRKEKVDNLMVGMFQHGINRNQDPHLHTHCVIANIVQKNNGDWRSAYLKKIFDDKKDYLGAVYRGLLAFECKKLGYEIDNQGKECFFELKNVSKGLLKEFSSRAQEIKNLVGANATAKEKADATLRTRKSKNNKIDRKEVFNIWRNKILEHQSGLSFNNSVEQGSQNYMSLAKEAVDFAIKSLGERNSVFTKGLLINVALTSNIGSLSPEHIEKRINDLIAKGKVLESPSERYKEYFTTPELLEREQETIALLYEGRLCYSPINANVTLEKSALNSGQREAVASILKSSDRVIGVQGYAGVGKSFMLAEAKKEIEKKGFEFIGLSPTGTAVENLRVKSGIKQCMTLEMFLTKHRNILEKTQEGLKAEKTYFANKIAVLDEAGMVSTEQMKDFLKISNKLNFRSVLIGDSKQLDSVEAGNPYYELQKAGMATSFMDEILRQDNRALKGGIYSTIKGDIESAFKQIGDNIIEFGVKFDKSKSKKELASDREANKFMGEELVAGRYLSFTEDDRANTVVVAQSNQSKTFINNLIREGLKKEGKLAGTELKNYKYININLEAAKKSKSSYYQEGHIILFNKKIDFLDINKGDYAKVINVDQNNNHLTIKHNNKTHIIDPKKLIGSRKGLIDVFEEQTILLQKGDKIIFTRSIKDNVKVLNSQKGEIGSISSKGVNIFLDGDKRKKITIPLNSNLLNHIDYSYCSTAHKAQGSDAKYVIALAESWRRNLTNQKNFYVEISRAKEKAFLFVDDKQKLITQLSENTGSRISALEHQKPEEEKKKYYKLDISEEDLRKGFEAHAIKEFANVPGIHIAVRNALYSEKEKIRFGEKNNHEISWNGKAGYIKDFKSGKYSSFNGNALARQGKAKYTEISREESEQIKAKQQEEQTLLKQKQDALHQQISNKASKWYQEANRHGKSQYLAQKGLDSRGLEEIRYSNFGMLMPLKDVDGKIWSMQIIRDNGEKIMMKGGKKRGNFFVIDEDSLKKSNLLFVTEGLATGGSVYKASKQPVVVAVDAGNLRDVVKNIKDKYPEKEIVVVADNDCWKKQKNINANNIFIRKNVDDLNKGISVAKKIKNELGVKYITPEFKEEISPVANSDFNDLAKLLGDKEVENQIKKQCKAQGVFVKHLHAKQMS